MQTKIEREFFRLYVGIGVIFFPVSQVFSGFKSKVRQFHGHEKQTTTHPPIILMGAGIKELNSRTASEI